MTTINGALSLTSSGEPIIDLYFALNRGQSETRVGQLLEAAWNTPFLHEVPGLESFDSHCKAAIMTLRCIFEARDIRHRGKGERRVFLMAIEWLANNHSRVFTTQLSAGHFEFFGSWRDLVVLAGKLRRQHRSLIVAKLTNQLVTDLRNSSGRSRVSLCAKWIPTESSALDVNGLVTELAAAFGQHHVSQSGEDAVIRGTKQHFRKFVVSPLRQYLKLIETEMSSRRWSTIKFDHIPSKAMLKYTPTLKKQCRTRFSDWQRRVKIEARATTQKLLAGKPVVESKTKMCTSTLHPHEILAPVILQARPVDSEDLDTAWEAYVAHVLEQRVRKSTSHKSVMVIADTSGSMVANRDGVSPLTVAVSLALLLSELARGPFQNKWMSFSTSPRFEMVKVYEANGTKRSIVDRVREISRDNWTMSTNVQAALTLLLKTALESPSPDTLPKILCIISDMQWNPAFCGDRDVTNFEAIKNQFEESGLMMPLIVFWNVSSLGTDVPVAFDSNGVALVSGFNPAILDALLMGDAKSITPLNFVISKLSSAPFSRIVL